MGSYVLYLLALLSAIFVYNFKNLVQYYIKFIGYASYWMISSLILIPVFLLRPANPYNFVVSGTFTPLLIYLMGLKYVVRGKEYLQSEGSYVVVQNHQSCIDSLGTYSIWHLLHKCTVIVKKEIGYFLPFYIGGWLCNAVFIDRSNLKMTKIKMKEAGDKFRKDGTKVVIYPEGKRFQTGKIEAFKKGAFHMAIDCQLPIMPLVFSRYYFIDAKKKIFSPGTIIMSALPPISTKGLTSNNVEELLEKTHKIMSEEFEKISKEAANMLNKKL